MPVVQRRDRIGLACASRPRPGVSELAPPESGAQTTAQPLSPASPMGGNREAWQLQPSKNPTFCGSLQRPLALPVGFHLSQTEICMEIKAEGNEAAAD